MIYNTNQFTHVRLVRVDVAHITGWRRRCWLINHRLLRLQAMRTWLRMMMLLSFNWASRRFFMVFFYAEFVHFLQLSLPVGIFAFTAQLTALTLFESDAKLCFPKIWQPSKLSLAMSEITLRALSTLSLKYTYTYSFKLGAELRFSIGFFLNERVIVGFLLMIFVRFFISVSIPIPIPIPVSLSISVMPLVFFMFVIFIRVLIISIFRSFWVFLRFLSASLSRIRFLKGLLFSIRFFNRHRFRRLMRNKENKISFSLLWAFILFSYFLLALSFLTGFFCRALLRHYAVCLTIYIHNILNSSKLYIKSII